MISYRSACKAVSQVERFGGYSKGAEHHAGAVVDGMGVAKQGRQHGDHRREQDRAAGRVRIGNLASEAAYSGG